MSAALTLSEHVNVLVAAYVAIEAKQHDPATPDAEADILGQNALAVMTEVEAIDDMTGNADLAAALLLMELMLNHPYPELCCFDWDKDDRASLRILDALAGSTTGEVRRHTAAVLATIGVMVPAEAADPMLALIAEINATWTAAQPLPDAEREPIERATLSPLWRRLWKSTPGTTSIAGAAAALRYLLNLGSMEDEDAAVVASVATFLEGRAGA